MKINAQHIVSERLDRRWTQEELAIAAALELDLNELEREELPSMRTWEYKHVELKRKVLKTAPPKPVEILEVLNAEGAQGWQLSHIQYPHAASLDYSQVVIYLMRETTTA